MDLPQTCRDASFYVGWDERYARNSLSSWTPPEHQALKSFSETNSSCTKFDKLAGVQVIIMTFPTTWLSVITDELTDKNSRTMDNIVMPSWVKIWTSFDYPFVFG